jgi:hypothetical protein
VDLTGEPSYMKWIADECVRGEYSAVDDIDNFFRCHDLAASTGAVLIPCSGFDSIPSDASVHMSNKTLKEHSPDATLDSSVTSFRMAGGISGGTFDSLFTFLDIPADDRKNSVRSFAYSPSRCFPPLSVYLIADMVSSERCSPVFLRVHICSPTLPSHHRRLLLHERLQSPRCPTHLGTSPS